MIEAYPEMGVDTSVPPLENQPQIEMSVVKTPEPIKPVKEEFATPNENKNNIPPTAVPSNVFEAIGKMSKLGFSPVYGAAYSKFDVGGTFTRRRETLYERYGIFNVEDGKFNRISPPMLYIMKVDERQYKEVEFSHCCCCGNPIETIDPPTWIFIDPQTNKILMKVTREPNGATEFITKLETNPEVFIHTDRPSICFRGDMRTCGCGCCYPSVVVERQFKKTLDSKAISIYKANMYGGVKIKKEGKTLYDNYDDNRKVCCGKPTCIKKCRELYQCCDCCDLCCGCCYDDAENVYIPSTRWEDPNGYMCCHCSLCSYFCPKPVIETTDIKRFHGSDRNDVIVKRTVITPLNQTDVGFVANAEIIDFTDNIPFEDKIAIILAHIIPHSDDDYDRTKIPCYSCS